MIERERLLGIDGAAASDNAKLYFQRRRLFRLPAGCDVQGGTQR